MFYYIMSFLYFGLYYFQNLLELYVHQELRYPEASFLLDYILVDGGFPSFPEISPPTLFFEQSAYFLKILVIFDLWHQQQPLNAYTLIFPLV